MEFGHFHTLRIVRFTDHGALLDNGEGGEILLPKNYTLPEQHVGDEVRVFVYHDQQGRPVATTEQPKAEVGQFALLRVAWTNRYGAFMDWGLMKDLFVPFSEQHRPFAVGKRYLIYIYVDEKTGRITGTSRLNRCLQQGRPPYQKGDRVEIIVWQYTEMGFKVIVDGRYQGLVYENEVFRPLHVGDKLPALVKQVRPDGKLDIALQAAGRQLVDDVAPRLLQALRQAGGYLPYDDHTSPEEIADRFFVSKKAFKRAVGALYRQHLILLTDDGIHLAEQQARE